MVHHGGVDVRHGVDAHRDYQTLQQVDHLRRVEQVRARPAQHVPAKTALIQWILYNVTVIQGTSSDIGTTVKTP